MIRWAADDGEFLEVHEHFAQNIVVGFARLAGKSVGVIANQPKVLAGVLDISNVPSFRDRLMFRLSVIFVF